MTTLIPMKLGYGSPADVENYLTDPAWVLEQKMDGARALAHWNAETGQLHWTSGTGGLFKFAAGRKVLPQIEAELIGLLQDAEVWTAILDGEVMPESGEFRIFDLVQLSHTEAGVTELAMTHGYGARRAVLSSMIPANGARISLVLSTTGEIAKRALWEAIVAAGVEGAVAKRLDAVYVPGTRSPSMVKMKITKDADVIVTSWERPDRTHGSATFAVYEDGALKEIGACSLIGKPNVEVGDVIEVEYLYVGAGDRLIQPRMKRRRTDKLAVDCTTEQLPSYSKASI